MQPHSKPLPEQNNPQYLRSGLFATGGKFLNIALMLIINALITRLLPTADVGIYFVLSSLTMVAANLAMFGQQLIVVKFIASALAHRKNNDAAGIARSALLIATTTGTGILILFILTWHYFENWFSLNLGLLGGAVCGTWTMTIALQTVAGESFRGFGRIGVASLFSGLISALMLTLFLITLLLWGSTSASLSWVLWGAVGSQAIGAIAATTWLIQQTKAPSRISKINLTNAGFRFMSATICALVVSQIDLWYVGSYLSAHDAALYGAGMRIVLLVTLPLVMANAVIMPRVAHLHAIGELKQLQSLLRTSATLTGLPSVIGLTLAAIFGGPVLVTIFGSPYINSDKILMILSAGQIIYVLGGSSGVALLMTGHERDVIRTQFILLMAFVAYLMYFKPSTPIEVALASSVTLVGSKICFSLFVWIRLKIITLPQVNFKFLDIFIP